MHLVPNIKGIDFLPHTPIFSFLYLWNLIVKTFDILNLDTSSNKIHSLEYQRYTTMRCKDKETNKLEFVAKGHFLYPWFCKINWVLRE